MKGFKILNAMMCEFIAEGANNKYTLVNTISGDLILQEFPAQISIAFYFELATLEDISGNFKIKIQFGKKEAATGVVQLSLQKGKPGVFVLPMGYLLVDAPNELKLTLIDNNGRPITLLKKQILDGRLPT